MSRFLSRIQPKM
uniref:Uncharacterized protein n=1 Tax=Rhizophora mucronata TaxID=61149 RepID=A0A2P2QUP0_RHIMU